ncbi:MAG: hypothetical protein BM557_11570 [Flavobacterium sp. MedPE-SWcel]|uniref:DUF2911 domain-containing protein n=1 Tax=uncultured Flavobacterium sp. TaxID=165435 RepID=UPI000910180D|nr:DUF2911 domain-containing protein [uncultured Flavobacterium sp.]OIQ15399.1 MAG: hypothetical protein BM557_11570 [Flavobacterium sp. MedPE-SWcel]
MENIKKIAFLFIAILTTGIASAQGKKASPAATATGEINGANITIEYSSPSVKGREIWGGLVPYSKVWRAGANKATTFKTDKDIMIEEEKLPAGKYSFFVIPENGSATIIFNKDAKQWGAYKYKESKDQLRVQVKTKKSPKMNERLVYNINNKDVTLSWDHLDITIIVK